MGYISDNKRYVKVLFFLTTIFTLTFVLSKPYLSDVHPDAKRYVKIAEGNITEVASHFAARVLMPYTASALSWLTGASIDFSFYTINFLSLLAFLCVFSLFIERLTHKCHLYLFFILSPILVYIFESYKIVDLFYCLFLLLLVVSLYLENSESVFLFILVLFLTRGKSTLLVSITIIILSYISQKDRLLYFVLASTALGFFASTFISTFGTGNAHDMSGLTYLVGKFGFNFLKNYIGLSITTNTLGVINETPLLIVNFPDYMPTGSVEELYIYNFSKENILNTFITLFSIFGTLPTILLYEVYQKRLGIFTNTPLFFSFSLLYGIISFFIGPCLGANVYRIVGYGWPAFWISALLIIETYYNSQSYYSIFLLVIFNLFAMWMAPFPYKSMIPNPNIYTFITLLLFHASTFFLWSRITDLPKKSFYEQISSNLSKVQIN